MKPRYSIIPGDFATDARADVAHFRVLNLIGRHTDEHGWCRLKQITIGEAVGLSRETVCRKLKDLVAWGYVEKRATDATGRAIFYRTIMDRPYPPPPVEIADDDDGCDCGDLFDAGPVSGGSHVEYNPSAELQPTCDPPLTPGVTHTITPGVTPAITHNDPFLTTKRRTPNPIGAADGEQAGDEAGQLIAALAAEGAPHDVVERLIRPVLERRRFSGRDKLARLRGLCDLAKGLPGPALDKAAQLVLDAGVMTVKPDRVADAIRRVRKAGAMVPIRKGTSQWSAWLAHFRATDPKQAELMARFDGWQVRAEWPPGFSPHAAAGGSGGAALAPVAVGSRPAAEITGGAT